MAKKVPRADPSADASSVSRALAMGSGSNRLTPEQKKFQKLIARIDAIRQELAQWHAFVPIYQRRCAEEWEPLSAKLRQERIALVRVLDRAMDSGELTRKQQAKVEDILMGQLSMLLESGDEAELVSLHDKYSEMTFEEVQEAESTLMRAMAVDALDLDEDAEVNSPEELEELIRERMERARAEDAAAAGRTKRANPDAAAREALQEQAERGASAAVRAVYRKLASELHPDRELDPDERVRKTVLMQRVNQAYEAGDLLALLELQLEIEQLDASALASLARGRLAQYNLVLAEQVERLEEELVEVTSPFVRMQSGGVPRNLTPVTVSRSLDADLREMKDILRELKTDVARFRDVNYLKASIKYYRVERPDDDDLMDSMMFDELVKGRR
jgi:hypothetical protein